jgi:hypothetical protein
VHRVTERLIAYAPAGTREGGWLLVNIYAYECTVPIDSQGTRMAIVIRPLRNGLHTLIGQVYLLPDSLGGASNKARDDPCQKQFDLYWHPQDLLVAIWHHDHRTPGIATSFSVADWLDMRICIEEGSSFARGPHAISDAARRNIDDQETVFLNTKISLSSGVDREPVD